MRTIYKVLFILSICIISFAQLSWAGPVTLKISTMAIEGTSMMDAFHAAEKEILEKTNGAVKFKIYTGGAMGTGKTLFRKIKFNQLHGGTFSASEAAPYCRDMPAPSMTFLFESYDEVDSVVPVYLKDLTKTFEKNGFVALAWIETGFSYLMSTDPIANLADFRVRKIWVPADDPILKLELKHLGVTPKPMNFSQATTGLMTGMIDTIGGPFIGAVMLQWFNKVKYILDLPLLYTHQVLLIKKESFDKISPAHQEIVKQVFAKFQKDIVGNARKSNEEAKQVLLGKGIKFIQPNPADMVAIKEKLKTSKKDIEDKDIFTDGIVDRILKSIEDYRAKLKNQSNAKKEELNKKELNNNTKDVS